MEIRKAKDIVPRLAENCHDGEGVLLCKNLLNGFDSVNFRFMHCDDLPAGVSIGNHLNDKNEEVYYLVSGKGVLTYDDNEYEMLAGDVSLCKIGHSHSFTATENCVLIVVGGVY